MATARHSSNKWTSLTWTERKRTTRNRCGSSDEGVPVKRLALFNCPYLFVDWGPKRRRLVSNAADEMAPRRQIFNANSSSNRQLHLKTSNQSNHRKESQMTQTHSFTSMNTFTLWKRLQFRVGSLEFVTDGGRIRRLRSLSKTLLASQQRQRPMRSLAMAINTSVSFHTLQFLTRCSFPSRNQRENVTSGEIESQLRFISGAQSTNERGQSTGRHHVAIFNRFNSQNWFTLNHYETPNQSIRSEPIIMKSAEIYFNLKVFHIPSKFAKSSANDQKLDRLSRPSVDSSDLLIASNSVSRSTGRFPQTNFKAIQQHPMKFPPFPRNLVVASVYFDPGTVKAPKCDPKYHRHSAALPAISSLKTV